jgi:G3E family GTPase
MQLFLIGGFLGSGKTTAIVNMSRYLMAQGKSVALITNDQGNQQVDSLFLKSFGIPIREVANGCFCCRYDELNSHLNELQTLVYPDYIFAESVGSCTDLIATVINPLRKFKSELKSVVNIFVDAAFISSLLEGRNQFEDESVRYIFKKQLEEADIIIVNKTDSVTAHQLEAVRCIIETDYPGKMIRCQNSNDITHIQSWLDELQTFNIPENRSPLNID